MPTVQKFAYLRSVLEGIAYQTIEGFEVTSAKYHHAVDALKHRFGRKRIIISSLVKSIVQLEPRSNKGVASLQDLHDTLKNRIRALEALGEKPMTHSCILLPILETKLPPELFEKWELELTDIKEESVGLELFFKFLNEQVISKEAGERNAGEDVYYSQTGGIARGNAGWDKNGTGIKNTREKTFTAAALLASGMNQSSNTVRNLCKQQGHKTLKCPELKRDSIEERWQLVRENRSCFNSLKPANTLHYSSVCRQPKCSVEGYGRRHHFMLHGDGDRSTEGQRQTTLSGFVSSYSPKMQQALLQTGTATLVADGDQRVNVRVLFDSGSHRSYINKNVAESLALDGPSEVLSVSMLVGRGSSQTKRMKKVSFSLTSVQGSVSKAVRMEALTIDKICTPLEPVEISLEKYPHLKGLTLADSYPRGSVIVDILIGADFYFAFMSGKCKKGETTNVPTTVESTLGWIVGGTY